MLSGRCRGPFAPSGPDFPPNGPTASVRRSARSLANLTSMDGPGETYHAQAPIDLTAITRNVAVLRQRMDGSQVMAVVKADGYGHGIIQAGQAAVAGGADWLGVVHVAEALRLRRAGITVPVLCLMALAEDAHAAAVTAGIDLTAGTVPLVRQIAAAAARAGRPARLQLKADTGLSRGGATRAEWPVVVDAALAAEADGLLRVTGLWSHFACADEPGHPSVAAQLARFGAAADYAVEAGLTPEVRHIANTAGALTVPSSRLDLVRLGGAIYGLSTLPGGAPGWLRPAMTLTARLAQVKRVRPGAGAGAGPPVVHRRDGLHGPVRRRLRR